MYMTEKQKPTKLRGFTLVEMMVVVAIIAILLTIFVPTITGYMTRSRQNASNSNAKILFNSVQTIAQEFEFSDRSADESTFYSTARKGKLLLSSWEGVNTVNTNLFTATGTDINGATFLPALSYQLNNPNASASFVNRLSRLFEENRDIYWVVVLEDYHVRAAFCATTADTGYIGAFPTRLNEKYELGPDVTMESPADVSDLAVVQNYVSNAWNTTFTFGTQITH